MSDDIMKPIHQITPSLDSGEMVLYGGRVIEIYHITRLPKVFAMR